LNWRDAVDGRQGDACKGAAVRLNITTPSYPICPAERLLRLQEF